MNKHVAFAPASVANVGVGFDIMGFSLGVLGDRVTAVQTETPGVSITGIHGVTEDLPFTPSQNTAGRAVEALLAYAAPNLGVAIDIEKGIPLGSGLGGSAASAVAAVVAANALLPEPLGKIDLLKFAMKGEAIASGALHVDNVAASLFGGLVLTVGIDNPRVKQIPVPPDIRAVVVHPHMFLATKAARAILNSAVEMSDFVRQTANLAGFISGCYTNDLDMIRVSFKDVIFESQRQSLIPGFANVSAAALDQGALGCSISGAGPSIFAWAHKHHALAVLNAMQAQFAMLGIASDAWALEIAAAGARLVKD